MYPEPGSQAKNTLKDPPWLWICHPQLPPQKSARWAPTEKAGAFYSFYGFTIVLLQLKVFLSSLDPLLQQSSSFREWNPLEWRSYCGYKYEHSPIILPRWGTWILCHFHHCLLKPHLLCNRRALWIQTECSSLLSLDGLTSKEASQRQCLYQSTVERSSHPVWKATRKRIRCCEGNFPFGTQRILYLQVGWLRPTVTKVTFLSSGWASEHRTFCFCFCFCFRFPVSFRSLPALQSTWCSTAPALSALANSYTATRFTPLLAFGCILTLCFHSTGWHNVFTVN